MPFSWLDVKLGARMLVKHPALTLIGGLGLAVGVALSVAFFAVLYTYVAPDLPLEEGDRIVAVENRDIERNDEDRRVLHDFLVWRDELRTVVDVGAFRTVSRNLIAGDGPPELIDVAEMTASGFTMARVPPRLGRTLLEADGAPGAQPVIVLGHDVWQARFGADPGIIGRDVRIGTRVHTVVGVMPAGFAFPQDHQYWVPLKLDADAHPRGEGPSLFVFGRLAPDVTMAQAQAELDVVGRRASQAWPDTHARLRPMVMPYTHSLTDIQGASLWEFGMMQFTMTLLLILVAANVAVLFYARTATRRGEIAVRNALGASRTRIVMQLFAEALLLSVGAAALGLLIAQVGIRFGFGIMRAELGGTPFWMDFSLQPATVLFTMALAVFAAVVVGVVPALQATGRGLQTDLRQLGGGTGLQLGRTWTALIVGQVAVAVLALPIVIGMTWSDASEWTLRTTYPAEEFIVAGVWSDPEEPLGAPFARRIDELERRVEAEPAVAGVTFQAALPDRQGPILVEGEPAPERASRGHAVSSIGGAPDQLALFDARLIAGRALGPADATPESDAVVVSRAFQRRVLGGEPAVGRRVRYVTGEPGEDASPPRWFEIVGVVDDLYANSLRPDTIPAVLYYAVAPDRMAQTLLVVRLRTAGDEGVAARIRELAVRIDPALRLGTVRSLAFEERMGRVALRVMALAVSLVLLTVFLLSAAGVYAMVAFTVTRRRREIGIRTALGAAPAQVLRSVFRRAALQIGAGVLVGVALATLLEIVSGGTMLGGKGVLLLPAFAIAMTIVALAAAFGPARRGLRLEPSEALRAEA